MMQLKQSIHWKADVEEKDKNHVQQQHPWLKTRRLSQQTMNCNTEEVLDAEQTKKKLNRKGKS